ncbi:MAG: methyltransferase domain-containing protein [Nanoarchaeota archaeon]|nr:methyltransferase domain-containing protein [Nanoarchaeota archaeon]
MALNREEGRTFGPISSLYDKARISYPSALIDDIIAFSGVENGKVLDVGCGTGQATILFAERGFYVTGVDISQQMIDVAKRKCSSLPNVDFKVGTFEEVELPEGSLDIVLSGMAWHWVAPEGRYEKVHRILKDNGTLALFWSYQQKEKSDFITNVGKILDKYDGVNRGQAGSLVKETADSTYAELKDSSLFTSVETREYEESFEFTKQRYLDLVVSYGWVQKLPDEKRRSLVEELQELYKKYEEPLVIPYKYVLVLAKSQSPK